MFFYILLSVSLMDILSSETADNNVFKIFLFPSSFSAFLLFVFLKCLLILGHVCICRREAEMLIRSSEVDKTAKWWDSPKQSERAFVWPVALCLLSLALHRL